MRTERKVVGQAEINILKLELDNRVEKVFAEVENILLIKDMKRDLISKPIKEKDQLYLDELGLRISRILDVATKRLDTHDEALERFELNFRKQAFTYQETIEYMTKLSKVIYKFKVRELSRPI